VWADVLRRFRESGWRFADAAHLRAFLARLTRDRFIDRLRRERRAVERELPWKEDGWEDSLSARDPRPSAFARADELWQEMLDLCPPEHQEVLRLKRGGMPTAEIATRTGLHEGSIRRILCTLSRRLARRHGEAGPEARRRP
jgi:RNA polymerase sigma-70 factor (ECF subfamily)